jgi:hypothetical protein
MSCHSTRLWLVQAGFSGNSESSALIRSPVREMAPRTGSDRASPNSKSTPATAAVSVLTSPGLSHIGIFLAFLDAPPRLSKKEAPLVRASFLVGR